MADQNGNPLAQLHPDDQDQIKQALQYAWQSGKLNAQQAQNVSGFFKQNYGGFNPDSLAANALAQQGLGPAASPGGKLLVPVAPNDPTYQGQKQYESLEFNPTAKTQAQAEDQQAADALIYPDAPKPSAQAAWNSATRNDPNPVFMGPARIAGGAIDYAESFTNPDPIDAGRAQRYSAGTNVIGGAMQTATPLLPGALAAAPLRTLAALGAAGGAGYTAKKATEAAGGTQEAQDFAENAAAALPYSYALGLRGGKFNVERPVPQEPIKGPDGGQIIPPSTSVAVPDTVATGIQGEALGGRVKGAVIKTSEGTTVAGKVGPYTASKTFGKAAIPSAPAEPNKIGELSDLEVANFQRQQSRAMEQGDTAAADALAGIIDADASAKAAKAPKVLPKAVSPKVQKLTPIADAATKDNPAPTQGIVERRDVQRSETSSVMLNQLYTQLRAATTPQDKKEIQAAIDNETDLGLRDAAAREAERSAQSTQQPEAEQRTKVSSPRDIEGQAPQTVSSEPIGPASTPLTEEGLRARDAFLNAQEQLGKIQTKLKAAESAAIKGHTRGAMNQAGVDWHTRESARLQGVMDNSLRNFVRAATPQQVDEFRRTLKGRSDKISDTATKLDTLVKTDKMAKAVRGAIPTVAAPARQAMHDLLGDREDIGQQVLRRIKYYGTPELKRQVEEAHDFIAKQIPALEAGTDVEKARATRFKEILANKEPVILRNPLVKANPAQSALPEITLRTVASITGQKNPAAKNPKLTKSERLDAKDLAEFDPEAAKKLREKQARGYVKGLADAAAEKAVEAQRQLSIVDRASGAGRRADEKLLDDLMNKRVRISEVQTRDLAALVKNTAAQRKIGGSFKNGQIIKARLDVELQKRQQELQGEHELLHGKISQAINTKKLPGLASDAPQLPARRYFDSALYSNPQAAEILTARDRAIEALSPSKIKKALPALERKIAKHGNPLDIALHNAYETRLKEKGEATVPGESFLDKIAAAAKKSHQPEEAPLTLNKGDFAEFQLPTGNKIGGTVESIIDGKVKIIRPNGSKNIQPIENWIKPTQTAPKVVESNPVEAQKTEAISPKGPSAADTKPPVQVQPPLKKVFDEGGLTVHRVMEAGKQVHIEQGEYKSPAKETKLSPAAEKIVSQAQDSERQAVLAKFQKISDMGSPEMVGKILEWTKLRTDLDAVAKRNLASDMADAYLTDPTPGTFSRLYKMSRAGAPALSTWTAETGGEKARARREEAVANAKEDGYDPTAIAKVVVRGGADFTAIEDNTWAKDNDKDGSLAHLPDYNVLFTDPQTGTTMSMPIDQVSEPMVKARVAEKRAQFDTPKQPPLPALDTNKADAKAALGRAMETGKAIEKIAGETGVNMLTALARGLDLGNVGKIHSLEKALTLYHEGLKNGDPMAMARARDFLLAQNGEPRTGRASLFGLDVIARWLIGSAKQQLPLPTAKLQAIQNQQAKDKAGIPLTDKLRALPYSFLNKVYDQFNYLDQNPTWIEKKFAPELIKNFQNRTGIKEIPIDINPWKQARLAYGGGGGLSQAAQITIGKIAAEASDAGLLDNLKAHLNLVAYDRAIRNIRSKAVKAAQEASRLRQDAATLEGHIQAGVEPQTRMSEVFDMRKEAREQQQLAKQHTRKLVNREVVPEQYTQASIAQDMRDMQQFLGPREYKTVEDLANRVYAELEKSWDDLHASGMLPDAIWQRGKDLGRGYIPLQRIFDVLHDVNARFGNATMAVRSRQALQELEGSKLYNQDPLEAALTQIQVAAREAQKNLVAKTILNLAHLDPTGYGRVIGIPGPGFKLSSAQGTMVVWDKGERTTYVVPRFLAASLENATPSGTALVGSALLRSTAAVFRKTATLANVAFAIPNAVRDIQDFSQLSKDGINSPFDVGTLVHDWVSSVSNALREDPTYIQMLRARAGFSNLQRNISGSVGDATVKHSHAPVVGALTHGNIFMRPINAIEDFNNVIEEATKLTAFKRGYMNALQGARGPLTKAQLDQVAWETRNYGGSPDFASKGTMSAAINLAWMFFNAKVQGTGRTIRRMLDPKRATVVLGTFTLMAAALTAHNLEFIAPEGDLEWNHVAQTDKQNYYVVLLPGTYQTSTGGTRHNSLKVSKGHLGQLLSNPLEDAFYSYATDRGDIGQTALDFAGNLLPGQFNLQKDHVAQGVGSGILSSLNPAIREPIDQARGMDSFKNVPIEPRGMENLENPEKYDPTTSVTARKITRIIYDNTGQEQGLARMPIVGQALTSPMRFEHAAGGFFTGVGDSIKNLIDTAQGQDKQQGYPMEGNEAIGHLPGVGPVARRFVGSPLDQVEKDLENQFYSAADSARVIQGTFNHHAQLDPDKAEQYLNDPKHSKVIETAQTISDMEKELGRLRQMQKQVVADTTMQPDQKKQMIQEIHSQRLEILHMFQQEIQPYLITHQ